MVEQAAVSRKLFVVSNYVFLTLLAASCIFPIVHIFAVSLSSSLAVAAGKVSLWPVDFTFDSYRYIVKKPEFLQGFIVSLQRVALGVSLNMLLTLLSAYPMSKGIRSFRWRTAYAWFFVFTILFSGGLIPVYMFVQTTGILDTIWALILPGAVPVFNVILLLNFFRELPQELEEAAYMDGAGHWTVLWKIYAPLSAPALATIGLFSIVGHWNAWFDGIIFMDSPQHYPLQSYLRTVIADVDLTKLSFNDQLLQFEKLSARTLITAQIFLGALPMLLVYPFLQKYFMKGIVLGSVKG